ncbi:unnamed protein product [Tuber aestivum]|uniref:Uncharacterized protein n=1 Tax=Tuber aestivum TaxID=59557 RepID=A0A292PYY6_9PEZI|nr:unnamed protein product [Tuber aestivum]
MCINSPSTIVMMRVSYRKTGILLYGQGSTPTAGITTQFVWPCLGLPSHAHARGPHSSPTSSPSYPLPSLLSFLLSLSPRINSSQKSSPQTPSHITQKKTQPTQKHKSSTNKDVQILRLPTRPKRALSFLALSLCAHHRSEVQPSEYHAGAPVICLRRHH